MKLYFEFDGLDYFSPILLPQPKNISHTYGNYKHSFAFHSWLTLVTAFWYIVFIFMFMFILLSFYYHITEKSCLHLWMMQKTEHFNLGDL